MTGVEAPRATTILAWITVVALDRVEQAGLFGPTPQNLQVHPEKVVWSCELLPRCSRQSSIHQSPQDNRHTGRLPV